MRLQIETSKEGRRILLSLEPDEAEAVAEQLRLGLDHQAMDKTHSHSILLTGTKESVKDVAHIIINAPLKVDADED